MAGMFVSGNSLFTTIGVGTMIVVLAAMIGSLTVLPALLHRLGDNVDCGRIPHLPRRGPRRRPVGPLRRRRAAASAARVRRSRRARSSLLALPAARDAHEAAEPDRPPARPEDRADVRADPAGVPGLADAGRGRRQGAGRRHAADAARLRALPRARARDGRALPAVHGRPRTRTGRSRASTSRSPATATNAASMRALHTLRDTVIPPIAQTLPDTEVAVTGVTAGTYDFNHQMRARLPYVFLFVLGLAFVLLLLTFRSLVIAATAVALNLLSVGAAYGILVAVFQHGWLAGVARLPDERRDRQLAAAVPLRRPLRPLDGLPRLHPQPDQGAARRRAPRPTTRCGSRSPARPGR